MKPTIIEDYIFEFELFQEEGSVLMAAETSWRGMADESPSSVGWLAIPVSTEYSENYMKNKSHHERWLLSGAGAIRSYSPHSAA